MATVVFFHAHPDDEAIATGGTMALMSDAGHRVVLVCATRGEIGEPAEGVLGPGEALGDRRSAELQRSCDVLGVDALEFLGYRDSGMVGEASNDDPACFWQADLEEAAQRFAALLTTYGCDVVVGYDPHGTYGHPDHVKVHLVGERGAQIAGVRPLYWATANRTRFLEARAAGDLGDVDLEDDDRVDVEAFGMPEEQLTHAIDVSSVLERKRASLAAHESQITEESFFLAMPDEVFTQAFGTEFYVDAARHRVQPLRQGDFATALVDD